MRELLSIQGLLPFPADVDTRQVLDAVDEQVVDTFVRGWDRRLVERLAKCSPEVGSPRRPHCSGSGVNRDPIRTMSGYGTLLVRRSLRFHLPQETQLGTARRG